MAFLAGPGRARVHRRRGADGLGLDRTLSHGPGWRSRRRRSSSSTSGPSNARPASGANPITTKEARQEPCAASAERHRDERPAGAHEGVLHSHRPPRLGAAGDLGRGGERRARSSSSREPAGHREPAPPARRRRRQGGGGEQQRSREPAAAGTARCASSRRSDQRPAISRAAAPPTARCRAPRRPRWPTSRAPDQVEHQQRGDADLPDDQQRARHPQAPDARVAGGRRRGVRSAERAHRAGPAASASAAPTAATRWPGQQQGHVDRGDPAFVGSVNDHGGGAELHRRLPQSESEAPGGLRGNQPKYGVRLMPPEGTASATHPPRSVGPATTATVAAPRAHERERQTSRATGPPAAPRLLPRRSDEGHPRPNHVVPSRLAHRARTRRLTHQGGPEEVSPGAPDPGQAALGGRETPFEADPMSSSRPRRS